VKGIWPFPWKLDAARAGVEAYQFDGMPADFRMTVSVGVAQFEKHGNSIAELVASADAALYDAKNGGRDRMGLAT
jgi:diguanylate cyclase (GGDEF)-like protein